MLAHGSCSHGAVDIPKMLSLLSELSSSAFREALEISTVFQQVSEPRAKF